MLYRKQMPQFVRSKCPSPGPTQHLTLRVFHNGMLTKPEHNDPVWDMCSYIYYTVRENRDSGSCGSSAVMVALLARVICAMTMTLGNSPQQWSSSTSFWWRCHSSGTRPKIFAVRLCCCYNDIVTDVAALFAVASPHRHHTDDAHCAWPICVYTCLCVAAAAHTKRCTCPHN